MTNAELDAAQAAEATHNLSGQKLGPKGLAARERIIKAMKDLLHGTDPAPITLSAVAREAGMGMSTLYLYFQDLAGLLLVVLQRIALSHEELIVERVGIRWPDKTLHDHCETFVRAHFHFWQRHARMLIMRNVFADAHDERLLHHRHTSIAPVIERLAEQMDMPEGEEGQEWADCAIILFTGLERVSTVVINPHFSQFAGLRDEEERRAYIERLIHAQTNVIFVMIREMRARTRALKRAKR